MLLQSPALSSIMAAAQLLLLQDLVLSAIRERENSAFTNFEMFSVEEIRQYFMTA